MKKFIIFTILLTTLFLSIKVSHAQELEGGFSIYPGTVEIVENESYDLTIRNNENDQKQLAIKPVLFELDSSNRTMKLLDEYNSISVDSMDLSQNIQLSESEVVISAKNEKTIKVNYLKKVSDDTYIGVLVSEKDQSNNLIGVSSQIGSVILDYDLTPEVLGQMTNVLDISSDLIIANINFYNTITINSKLKNGSTKLVEPAGEVVMSEGTTRIDNISLTQNFPSYIFPDEEVEVQSEFVDKRQFWDRLGFTTYTQILKVNGQEITVSKDVFNLPWQVLFLAVLAVLILFILWRTKVRLNKKQNPKH